MISPASAVISFLASSKSAGASSASPHWTAAALIRCTAAVLMISTAGTSAMSLVSSSDKIPLSKMGLVLLGYLRLWAISSVKVDYIPTCLPLLKVSGFERLILLRAFRASQNGT